jgi:WD40 repeat protein
MPSNVDRRKKHSQSAVRWAIGLLLCLLLVLVVGIVRWLRQPTTIRLNEDERVNGLAFSPDGQTLYACTTYGIRRWSWPSRRPMPTFAPPCLFLSLSPDGRRLAVQPQSEQIVHIFTLPGGQEQSILVPPSEGGTSEIQSSNLAWHPDGQTLAVVELVERARGRDSRIRLWNLNPQGPQPGRVYSAGTPYLGQVAFSLDGQVLLAPYDREVLRWQVDDGQRLSSLVGGNAMHILVIRDKEFVIGAGGEFPPGIWLWQARDGQLLRVFQGHRDPVNQTALSPTGQYLASASGRSESGTPPRDTTVRLWRTSDGQQLRTLEGRVQENAIVATLLGHSIGTALTFSPDSKYLLIGHRGFITLRSLR